eukprot:TRINITY_DN40084_c0_g1_i1.p1 TRINITY_DN40084_c0_g1~~TRINITY_DN40084_c0_g1_i1.p1  ORF type:complete len:192 (+),score=47.47 TRINITY_DN40084_c0_g1_i1:68-643(+)
MASSCLLRLSRTFSVSSRSACHFRSGLYCSENLRKDVQKTAWRLDHQLRYSSSNSGAEASEATKEEIESQGDDEGNGLFCDRWWPLAASRCCNQLAKRPQGLPEDPMAQGVLSWVEYELARGEQTEEEEAEKAASKKTSTSEDGTTPSSSRPLPFSQKDEPPKPLPEDGKWRWILRNKGEMHGARGDPRSG